MEQVRIRANIIKEVNAAKMIRRAIIQQSFTNNGDEKTVKELRNCSFNFHCQFRQLLDLAFSLTAQDGMGPARRAKSQDTNSSASLQHKPSSKGFLQKSMTGLEYAKVVCEQYEKTIMTTQEYSNPPACYFRQFDFVVQFLQSRLTSNHVFLDTSFNGPRYKSAELYNQKKYSEKPDVMEILKTIVREETVPKRVGVSRKVF